MDHRIPFIDHESELNFIDSIIQDWGTRRIVCVDGLPSVGKTRLLQEIRQRYTNGTHKMTVPVVVSEIIDFDDPSLHLMQNIGCRISHMLGEKTFEPYLRVLLNWRKMAVSGVGLDQLNQAAFAVNQTFAECFKMVSARILLLLDNTEAIDETTLTRYITEVGLHLENVVIVLAGRNAGALGQEIQPYFGKDLQIIQSRPLSPKSSESYIYHKQAKGHFSLEADIEPKIAWLTNGNPLLLDLAVERYSQGTSPAWMIEQSVEELMALSEEEATDYRQEFEHQLAWYAVDTRHQKGWLKLVMTHIYPVDTKMITALFAISEKDADALFHQVSQDIVVKLLPNNRICLHEEARRIINDHMWQDADASGEKFRTYCQRAADFLQQIIAYGSQRLEQLQALESAELEDHEVRIENRDMRPRDTYFQLACDHFMERTLREQESDDLHVRQLNYALWGDLADGVRTFTRMFDETTKSYKFALRKRLIETTEAHFEKENTVHPYEWDCRRLVYLNDSGAYQDVCDLATTLLQSPNLPVEQQVTTLTEQGRAKICLGLADEGVADLTQAMELGKAHNLEQLWCKAQHIRGWAYSQQGRYDLALDDYLEAYQRALKNNDSEQIAWIMHNISFVHALRGNRQSALESCNAAMDIWKELGNPRGIGATYVSMGEAYVRFNQPSDALFYYTKGLDIFSWQHDIEWISIARCGRAFAFQSLGDREKAKIEQEWVLNNGSIILQPRILHSQFLTYLSEGAVALAREKLLEGRKISRQIKDGFNDYKAFADLVELAWEFDECGEWKKYHDEHSERYMQRVGVDALRLRGSCMRKIADLAVCAGAYDEALQLYEHALPLIAEYEVHERYTIRSQLRQTDKRLRDRVPDSVMTQLGKDLALFWQTRSELVTRYPEVLLLFSRW